MILLLGPSILKTSECALLYLGPNIYILEHLLCNYNLLYVTFILQLSNILFINITSVGGLNYLWVLLRERRAVCDSIRAVRGPWVWPRPTPAERSSARQGSLWHRTAAPRRSRVAAPPRAPGPSGRARLRPGREAPFDQQRPGRV